MKFFAEGESQLVKTICVNFTTVPALIHNNTFWNNLTYGTFDINFSCGSYSFAEERNPLMYIIKYKKFPKI